MATFLVNAGKAIVTARLIGATQALPTNIGWGTGAGTTTATDTTLFTEDVTAGYARATATASQVTTTVTNDTIQYVGTQTALAALTITNAGNFDAATAGNMFVKGDFTGIALNIGDSIQFTIKCQFT